MTESKKVDRRSFLKYAATVVATGVVVGAATYYVAPKGREITVTAPGTTTTVERTVTKTVTATGTPTTIETTPMPSYTLTKPLQLYAWDYHPEIISQHLDAFKEQTGLTVELNVFPYPGYLTTIQTKIMGGTPIDVLYVQNHTQLKWYNAGWLYNLDEFPEAKQIKNDMYKEWITKYTTPEGTLITLPYWTGSYVHMINRRIMEENGFEYPKSLEDIYEQCKKLSAKGMKAPYTAYWSWQLEESVVEYMVGEGVELFDEKGRPLFEGDPNTKYVLEWMYKMFRDGCTSPTITTDDVSTIVTAWLNGESYICNWHSYFIETFNRSGEGPEKGNCVVPPEPPSSTKRTIQIGDCYGMFGRPQAKMEAWELLKFLGWKDRRGEYRIATTWAYKTGLLPPYKDWWEDPTHKKALSEWVDFDLLKTYFEKYSAAVPFRVNILWYFDWVVYMEDQVKKMLAGEIAPDDVVKKIAEKAKELGSA